MSNIPRRRIFLRSIGGAGVATATATASVAAAATATVAAQAPATSTREREAIRQSRAYTFLNPAEARFVEAAVARLIPSDDAGPGAIEAGVPNYIDKQLGGAWGAGERLYRSGPWSRGERTQGYQLPYTPAELLRAGIRAVDEQLQRTQGRRFADLSPEQRDTHLTALQQGKVELGDVPSATFFGSLLEMTIEGFFSDPVYGGNRDMIGWRLIGFPGAYANYYHLIDSHGMSLDRAPMSLAEDSAGHVHQHPGHGLPPAKPSAKPGSGTADRSRPHRHAAGGDK